MNLIDPIHEGYNGSEDIFFKNDFISMSCVYVIYVHMLYVYEHICYRVYTYSYIYSIYVQNKSILSSHLYVGGPGTDLRLSAFTHGATSPAPKFYF